MEPQQTWRFLRMNQYQEMYVRDCVSLYICERGRAHAICYHVPASFCSASGFGSLPTLNAVKADPSALAQTSHLPPALNRCLPPQSHLRAGVHAALCLSAPTPAPPRCVCCSAGQGPRSYDPTRARRRIVGECGPSAPVLVPWGDTACRHCAPWQNWPEQMRLLRGQSCWVFHTRVCR